MGTIYVWEKNTKFFEFFDKSSFFSEINNRFILWITDLACSNQKILFSMYFEAKISQNTKKYERQTFRWPIMSLFSYVFFKC